MSLMISSADRLSFHAPENRSAQPVSVFVSLVGTNIHQNLGQQRLVVGYLTHGAVYLRIQL